MATSSNTKIQQLMNEAESLDANDGDLEEKLRKIAEAVAAEQNKQRAIANSLPIADIVDPAEVFACEGCQ